SNSAQDYIPNLAKFAQQGYDLVVSVGFAQADAVATVAKRFPQTHFAIIDVDATTLKGKPQNVLGLLFREQEVGYLAGYLAGLVEKQKPGPDVIGSVGGMKEPPVDRFIAGYQAGAKKAVDQAVFLTIKDVIAGTFHGGRNSIFGLKDNGVGLGRISPKVPHADVAAVAKIRSEIADGKLSGIPTTVS